MLWVVLALAVSLFLVGFFRARRSPPLLHISSEIFPRDSGPSRTEETESAGVRALGQWSEKERARFFEVWHSVCAHFDDDPRAAVCYADLLVSDLLHRPAPRMTRDENAPEVVLRGQLRDNYHAAHAIAVHEFSEPIKADDLRRAMSLYRDILDELFAHAQTSRKQ